MANRGGRGGFRLPVNRNPPVPPRRVDSDSWGIALLGPSEKGCLLINERLGQGSFSTAQLVLNRENTVRLPALVLESALPLSLPLPAHQPLRRC